MTTLESGTQVEAEPVDGYDVANKQYVDDADTAITDDISTSHVDDVTPGETGPTITARAGVRAAFVYWSDLDTVVSGHGYYQVQMATDSGFTAIVDDLKTKSTWATFDGLDTTTLYYWRVRAVDAAGNASAWTGTAAQTTPDEIVTDDLGDDSVTAIKIAALTANDVVVGASPTDATGIIRSANYSAGSAGWQIVGDGNAEFNNVTVRGTVDASTISGSTIESTTLRIEYDDTGVSGQWFATEILQEGVIELETAATQGGLATTGALYATYDSATSTGNGVRLTTIADLERRSDYYSVVHAVDGGGGELLLADDLTYLRQVSDTGGLIASVDMFGGAINLRSDYVGTNQGITLNVGDAHALIYAQAFKFYAPDIFSPVFSMDDSAAAFEVEVQANDGLRVDNLMDGSGNTIATLGQTGNEKRFYLGGESNDWIGYDPIAEVGRVVNSSAEIFNWSSSNGIDAGSYPIQTSGEVLIGAGSVSTPGIAFSNDQDTGFYRENTNIVEMAHGGTRGFYMQASLFTGIGSGTHGLGNSGNRWGTIYTNSAVDTSDPRSKSNVRSLDGSAALDFIRRLEPVEYEFIEDGVLGVRPHHGLDADQVGLVLEELGIDHAGYVDPSKMGAEELARDIVVELGKALEDATAEELQAANDHVLNGMKGLRYNEFIPDIIAAVQALADMIPDTPTTPNRPIPARRP